MSADHLILAGQVRQLLVVEPTRWWTRRELWQRVAGADPRAVRAALEQIVAAGEAEVRETRGAPTAYRAVGEVRP